MANETSNDIARTTELKSYKSVNNILLDIIDEEIPIITNDASASEMKHQSFNEAVNPISDNDTSFVKKESYSKEKYDEMAFNHLKKSIIKELLTLSRGRLLSYRNQFLYNNGLRHERVKSISNKKNICIK